MSFPRKSSDSELEKKLKAKDEERTKALENVESMKAQSTNLTKEYDRLVEEKDKLELLLLSNNCTVWNKRAGGNNFLIQIIVQDEIIV